MKTKEIIRGGVVFGSLLLTSILNAQKNELPVPGTTVNAEFPNKNNIPNRINSVTEKHQFDQLKPIEYTNQVDQVPSMQMFFDSVGNYFKACEANLNTPGKLFLLPHTTLQKAVRIRQTLLSTCTKTKGSTALDGTIEEAMKTPDGFQETFSLNEISYIAVYQHTVDSVTKGTLRITLRPRLQD